MTYNYLENNIPWGALNAGDKIENVTGVPSNLVVDVKIIEGQGLSSFVVEIVRSNDPQFKKGDIFLWDGGEGWEVVDVKANKRGGAMKVKHLTGGLSDDLINKLRSIMDSISSIKYDVDRADVSGEDKRLLKEMLMGISDMSTEFQDALKVASMKAGQGHSSKVKHLAKVSVPEIDSMLSELKGVLQSFNEMEKKLSPLVDKLEMEELLENVDVDLLSNVYATLLPEISGSAVRDLTSFINELEIYRTQVSKGVGNEG